METLTPPPVEVPLVAGPEPGTVPLAESSVSALSVPLSAVERSLESTVAQFLNITAAWELALVVASVLIILALVGARAADALSGRDLEVPVLASLTEADDADETEATHTYEEYISPETPDELLSDKGQIIRILVENDGRTYQYQIVEETGWSKSKVSRLLSEMHEDGEIGKVSVGRENAIVLNERGPDDAGEAVDDEQSVEVTQSVTQP